MLRTFLAALMMLLMWILMQAAHAGFGQTGVETDKEDFIHFKFFNHFKTRTS
jgi:hypothetical protein